MSQLNPKAKFFLYMRQSGEGCDYTIGCGRNLISLKAQTREAALAEALEAVGDDGTSDRALSAAIVIEAAFVEEINVNGHYAAKAAEREANKKQQDTEARRREFERLKQEFGQ